MDPGVHATQNPKVNGWDASVSSRRCLRGALDPPIPAPSSQPGSDEPPVVNPQTPSDEGRQQSVLGRGLASLTPDGTPTLEASRRGGSWSWEPLAAHTLVTNHLENSGIEGPRCPVAVAGAVSAERSQSLPDSDCRALKRQWPGDRASVLSNLCVS